MQYCKLTRLQNFGLALLALIGLLTSPAGAVNEQIQPVAEVTLTPAAVFWQPHVEYGTLILTVSAPDGQVHRQEFQTGEPVTFSSVDKGNASRPDGSYTYELRVIPAFDKGVKKALAASREAGDVTLTRELQQNGTVPREPLTQTGYFTIAGGAIVLPTVTEPE